MLDEKAVDLVRLLKRHGVASILDFDVSRRGDRLGKLPAVTGKRDAIMRGAHHQGGNPLQF